MDQSDDPKELELKIEQASRIASSLNDPTTVERLTSWAQDLRHRLRQILKPAVLGMRSGGAPTNYGSKAVALQAATKSSGCKLKRRRKTAIRNELPLLSQVGP
jgi:hypothetical protein